MKVLKYSSHARKRMKLRGIAAAEIRKVLAHPTATVKQANGRIKAVGNLRSGKAIKVIFVETSAQIIIVTTF